MPTIHNDVLLELSFNILRAVGLPEEDAETVSEHLVTSNLKGHDSHGVARVPTYVEAMRKSYVRWESHEIVREAPALAVIDGHGANGIVAMRHVVDMVVDKARKTTFGAVGLSNVTHIGRVGDFPPRIAERDMIGMVWTNVGGVFTAPFGGVDRRMRPNPIAFAVPRRAGPPLMLDMTLSAVAGSKLKRAHGLGRLRVRGGRRVRLAVYLKALACNFKRMVHARLVEMDNTAQRAVGTVPAVAAA